MARLNEGSAVTSKTVTHEVQSRQSAATADFDLVVRFDEAWRAFTKGTSGKPPYLGEFLPSDSNHRKLVLPDLIAVDLERRLSAGEHVRAEDYLKSYSELNESDETVLWLLNLEHRLRTQTGKTPSRDEYLRRFPKSTDQLQKILIPSSGSDHCFTQARSGEDGSDPPRIGKYQVVRKLGEGTFGEVYLALDKNLRRHVAIKMLKRGLPQAQTLLEEARKQIEAKHPNIVGVLEASDDFIVYQFFGGGTLRDKLRQQPRLEPREAAALVAKLADALQSAHEMDVYHLDVKPSNILLDEKGNPFLADFGLAVTEEESWQLDAVRGSPAYMSPEQFRGEGHTIHGGYRYLLFGCRSLRAVGWATTVPG